MQASGIDDIHKGGHWVGFEAEGAGTLKTARGHHSRIWVCFTKSVRGQRQLSARLPISQKREKRRPLEELANRA